MQELINDDTISLRKTFLPLCIIECLTCVWMQRLRNVVHSRLFWWSQHMFAKLSWKVKWIGWPTIFCDHSHLSSHFHLLQYQKLYKICSLLEKHTFPEESQDAKKKYLAGMYIRTLAIGRCNFQACCLVPSKNNFTSLPPIWEYSLKKTCAKSLPHYHGCETAGIHFPDTKKILEVMGTAWLYSTVQMAVTSSQTSKQEVGEVQEKATKWRKRWRKRRRQ